MGQRIFEKEKNKIVQEGVEALNDEIEKKLFNLTMNLNIERSAKINSTRLQKMTERNNCIQLVKGDAKQFLLKNTVSADKIAYKNAVKNLIIQGMIKLLENELFLKIRKEDEKMIQGLIEECEAEF
mmetsp:Transcript_12472/g.9071  ORF Transcript_12472/g.9071 Transcript_12472/m.9071 type:complete len:126 (-) Transcript_12472:260-637(-)